LGKLHLLRAEITRSLREEAQRGTEKDNRILIWDFQFQEILYPHPHSSVGQASPFTPTLILRLGKLHLFPIEVTQSFKKESQRSIEKGNQLHIRGYQAQASLANRYWIKKPSAPFCVHSISLCAKKTQPGFGTRNSNSTKQNPSEPLCATSTFLCAKKSQLAFVTRNSISTKQNPSEPLRSTSTFLCAKKTPSGFGTRNSISTNQKPSLCLCVPSISLCAKKSQPAFGTRNSNSTKQNTSAPLWVPSTFLWPSKTKPEFGTLNSISANQKPSVDNYAISPFLFASQLNTTLPINLQAANS
jgi:hypothetical protein